MNSSNSDLFLGIEIGGTKLQITVGDRSGNVIECTREPILARAGAGKIREQIQDGITTLLHKHMIGAIGVGFGGPVEWKTGTIQLSHQIEGWGQFNLKTWLEELTGLPVAVDNDANVAALAEAKHGGGKGYNTVFYMTIGSGIGGGLIINERIYHGRKPGEVEVGHLRMNKDGITLESRCSGWAVNRKVQDYIDGNPHSLLASLAKNKNAPAAYFLTPALRQKDSDAGRILDEVADDISFALSHVVHLFNPDVIIIGGGLSLLGEEMRKRVSEKLPDYIMEALRPVPFVKIAVLGENVVPIGAHELAAALLHSPAENEIDNP